MAISTAELATIRDWVGDDPDDIIVADHYADTGHALLAARTILRRRYANLCADPAKFSVAGDHSADTAENIKAVRSQMVELDAAIAAAGLDADLPTALSVTRIVRVGRDR